MTTTTIDRPPVTTDRSQSTEPAPRTLVSTVLARLTQVLADHSISVLRVSLGLVVLAAALAGILSPLVLFPGQMWADNGPTLIGQYVFKDVVLAAAGLVVAAHALGARLRSCDRG